MQKKPTKGSSDSTFYLRIDEVIATMVFMGYEDAKEVTNKVNIEFETSLYIRGCAVELSLS